MPQPPVRVDRSARVEQTDRRRRARARGAALVAAVLAMLGATSGVAAPPAAAKPAAVQQGGGGALMIVMDASGSMRADDGTGRSKLDGAKAALRQAVAGLPDGAVAGLLVYGAHTPNTEAARAAGCQDTEVVVPPAPLDRGRMTAAIDGFAASGFTPIGRALQDATAALPTSGPRTVLLVSDGVDTCAPPDPCTVAGQLAKAGVELRLETVGFQVDPGARAQLECIARAGGGQYSDAADSGALAQRLVDVASRAARSYTSRGSPVKGGASYQDAPLLVPGTYSDTALAKEQSWYAVDLAAGQELTARSTLVIDDGDFGGIGALYEVQIVDPDLTNVCCAVGRGYQVNVGTGAATRAVSVSATSGVVGAIGNTAQKAGRYFVRITTDGHGAREYPIELDLSVADASTAPSSAAAAPPTAAPPTAAPLTDAAGGDGPATSTLLGVIGALSALVLGLVVAVVLLLRRDRARARGRST